MLGMDSTDWGMLCALLLAVTTHWKKGNIKVTLSHDDETSTADIRDSRDICKVMKAHKKNFLVLYASQTGTAEDYAKQFAKELTAKFSLSVLCTDVENYNFESLHQLPPHVVVSLFISTYGEGEFPDSALQFEKFLSAISEGGLSGLNVTLFGFGNSTYEFYNGASKKVMEHLKRSHATLIGNHGLADDGTHTTDEDYLAWKENTLQALKKQLRLNEHEQKYEPFFEVEKIDAMRENISLGEPSLAYLQPITHSFSSINIQLGPFGLNQPYVAPIVKSRELFEDTDRSCVHSEFDISGSDMQYTTGDHLGVWPSNADEKVNKFLYAFNLDPGIIFDLKPLDSTIEKPFPTPTTIGAAVRHYMEITGPISRQSFGSLVQFAPNDQVREKLQELAADKDQFSIEITSKCFDLADALLYLSGGSKWEAVPWEFLVETVPHLQPRYYSISSSSLSEEHTIHITSVVETFPSPTGDGNVVGVTTNLLKNIEVVQNKKNIEDLDVHFDLRGPRDIFSGFKLPIHVRHSSFKLPLDPQKPIIMIGPGTGVAPFRGFIRERVQAMKTQRGMKLGKHLLFYGCRNYGDYLYKEEWPEYAKKLGSSFEMIVAHSRMTSKKIYVQDKLLEREAEVFSLIEAGGFLYVCGEAKGMAQGVNAVMVDIFSRRKSISKEQAAEMLSVLKVSDRYQEDVW
ncbi:probable NADPH--cytochrome P450 reductase [Zygosaccharomyces bailii ISA1307]|nr:probable NADPH--cytochrome P450 reductase [Zygosaccharomyces bailii ISA1307]